MLAIFAGLGKLPEALVQRAENDGIPFKLIELEGFESSARRDLPIIRFRIEHLGRLIAELLSLGVDRVCFAGKVTRPEIDIEQIDELTQELAPRMMAALPKGDDATLRAFLSFFEERGIKIIAAQEICPELVLEAGVYGRELSDHNRRDADRGIEILQVLSKADVGQACMVAQSQALAIETIGGTDWMIRSLLRPIHGPGRDLLFDGDASNDFLGMAADWLTGHPADKRLARDPILPPGGVLVKASKPGQDMRVDVPTIGPGTIQAAVEVGLEGIVIEAGNVLVLDFDRCLEMVKKSNLFLWVRP